MVDGQHDDEAPIPGAGATGADGAPTPGDGATGGDGALRSWALRAAAAGSSIPGAKGVAPADDQPLPAVDAPLVDTARPDAPVPDAALPDAPVPDARTPEEGGAAEAAEAETAPEPVQPTPGGQASGPSIPWFMPGGQPMDPGPEPDELPIIDEDAPVSARSWSEADLWTIPLEELAARISNVLPPSWLQPAEWPTTDKPGSPGGEQATMTTGEQPAVTTEDTLAAREASSLPATRAWAAPGTPAPGTPDVGAPEDALRATVLAAPDGGAGDRPRLTPATLAALVLLVVAAGSSFVFMVTRGGVDLASPAPRSPAAFVSRAPTTAPVVPTSSPVPSRAPSIAASVAPATPAPSKAPAPTTAPTAAPTPVPATVPLDRRYAETDPAITYSGAWGSATGAGYAGGAVAWSNTAGASATLSFTGRTITWWGPVGPTRGSATVFIDGASVGTISAYETAFTARRALFTSDFGSVGEHVIRIVVAGTASHPTVAIDEFVVGY